MKKCPYCSEQIQDDAIKCRYCGEFLEVQAIQGTSLDTSSQIPILFKVGFWFCFIGLILGVYFIFIFDPSVPVPRTELFGQSVGGGRVNNLGLMSKQHNGIIVFLCAIADWCHYIVGRDQTAQIQVRELFIAILQTARTTARLRHKTE